MPDVSSRPRRPRPQIVTLLAHFRNCRIKRECEFLMQIPIGEQGGRAGSGLFRGGPRFCTHAALPLSLYGDAVVVNRAKLSVVASHRTARAKTHENHSKVYKERVVCGCESFELAE